MRRRDFIKSAALTTAASVALPPWSALAQDSQAPPPVDPDVKLVLLTFMCHLDIGFTDTQTNVMETYFQKFYPQAIDISAHQRDTGGNRYIWTTAAWLLYEYLEQASPTQRRQIEQSIHAGDIAWHALPFNWQTEMLDRSMIEGCMGFSKSLDARFGLKTTGGKMTDVPGHSRGLVPPLEAAEVSFLDIGVNPASTSPNVPDAFLWKDPSGSSIAVLYHRHAYGGTLKVPNSDLAIAVNMRVDNTGPHTAEEIDQIYANLKKQFPNAKLKAATFSDIAAAMKPIYPRLPVVTQEIGDTWIYGAPSDPYKISRYREIARLRTEWVFAGKLSSGGSVDQQLLRRLALAPEHTWGTDTKRYIDHEHYSPKELTEYISKPNYQVMVRSWQEKRDDIDQGVASLPAPLRAEAEARLNSLKVVEPSHAGMRSYDPKSVIRTTHFDLALDPDTGCIQSLINRHTHRGWASKDHPLALFTYQTLTQDDYKSFLNAYVVSKAWWAPQDFGKPNIERLHPQARDWHPRIDAMWVSDHTEHHRVLVGLTIDDPASQQIGLVVWPARMYLDIVLPKDQPVVNITFYAMNKAPNRMPEAMWLTFKPQTTSTATWTFEKVNQDVSALDVVEGGGRRMHAVTSKFRVNDQQHQLEITTLDAPVVALGVRSPLNFSMDLPDLQQGTHVSLFNNAWGTNYPQWAGGDWMYRFTLQG
jgi:hypothetical protein